VLFVGILITSDEKEDTLVKGLEMLQSIFPEDAFYKREFGPQVIMSDNCDELRSAQNTVWPHSYLLLCVFHILQQVWRWLFEKKHGIGKNDRLEIMKLFRRTVYAESPDQFELASEELFNSPTTVKYNNCVQYFTDLWEHKESWATHYRNNMLIRGCNTNNYVESQFLVIKDTILKRQRQYNINMLLNKLMDDFEQHFKLRLISASDGTFDGIYSNRFKGK